MKLPFGIDQSTLAGGLSGLATLGIMLGLGALGVSIPQSVIAPLVLIVTTIVVHAVPDAAKIDQEIKDVAKDLPQTYAKPEDFPSAPKPPQSTSNVDR
jgi:hypothetical protein